MKRRKRRARHAGRRDAFHLTMIAVLMTVLCLMIVNIKEPEQTEEEQPETTHAEVVQNPETIVQTAEETERKYKVFDGMSEDWGSDDLEGFVLYKLPEQYADKGYFPEKMQIYTRCLCKQNDVPYALVLAIIEHESGYEFDKVGDGGQSTIDEQENVTAWDVLQKCLTTYRCECIIHSLTKTIDIYDRVGSDKGCYFMEGLNLRKISMKGE